MEGMPATAWRPKGRRARSRLAHQEQTCPAHRPNIAGNNTDRMIAVDGELLL
jgi:hypothetical protein